MRGTDQRSGSLFSYVDIEARVPKEHPLRGVRELVNGALSKLDKRFGELYSKDGRPSIAPERLLRASLLQLFYSIRSERQLMERMDFDLLFRWFVGLGIDDPVWDHSVFSKNRDRLLNTEIAQDFLAALLSEPKVRFFSSGPGHRGIKVIDFSEVPADVLPVVTGVFARLLYDIQLWMTPSERRPFCIFCDEAHLYLPTKEDADAVEKQALWNFERIAKEGRKYGFGLVVISQRPSDISRTILSQCNNFIALRLTNETDQAVVRKLVPDSLAQLIDALPLLDVGEAVILGDAMLLPTRVRLDPPSVVPASATRDFWREWNAGPVAEEAIRSAVELLRAQTRS